MSIDTDIELKAKIDELNQQAWDLRVNDSPKAFELSQESVKLARSISYPKGIAEGLRSLGFGYVRLSKNDEAAPLLQESLALFESLNDPTGQAICYEYLGIIERNWGNLGTSLEFLLKGNSLIPTTAHPELEITSCYQLGVTYKHLGDHESALDYLYRALSLSKNIDFKLMIAYSTNIIGAIYFDNGNYNRALDCFQQGFVIRQEAGDKWGEAGSLDNIGITFLKLHDLDRAISYCKQSLEICQGTGDKKGEANALLHLAEIYWQANDTSQASTFAYQCLEIRKARGDKRGEAEVLLLLADLYKDHTDIADGQVFEWISNALKIAEEIKAQDFLSKSYYHLHEYYKQKGDFKESLAQLEAHWQIEKELHKNAINQKVSNLEITHKAEETRKEAEAIRLKNEELTKLNREIEEQKNKLIIALAELKAAQAQLIQSEKMASLGELTAGIAHEIQNPLNFINNFSDVNTELIAELKEELEKGNAELVNKIASDISANEEKINHHGKRADSIVKSMLQHSRISSGKKELTDINALVYEYLRLAYHGLRAKDKSFNAKFETHFDPSLEKINVIAQDIGRVALNLINNAFYAVTERKQLNEKGFEPTVILSTKKNEDTIEIKVKDNGNGISQKVLDKIFQPFFTTKPTGQGTGLGLSLSYDIIKAHGGEIEVKTDEGKGTEFTIQLPLR